MAEKWIVTGGCGFIGANLVAALLEDGVEVVVLDTLVRLGSSENLGWLEERARRPGAGRLVHLRADTRSRTDVDDAFSRHGEGVGTVAHLAGQVAMTTSIERPRYDFEVNALGAMNVLEAIRQFTPRALAMFSSTNKVYGDLASLRHAETPTRWTLPDHPRGPRRVDPARLPQPVRLLEGGGGPVLPRLPPDLRAPHGGLPPLEHLRRAAARHLRSGLGGLVLRRGAPAAPRGGRRGEPAPVHDERRRQAGPRPPPRGRSRLLLSPRGGGGGSLRSDRPTTSAAAPRTACRSWSCSRRSRS